MDFKNTLTLAGSPVLTSSNYSIYAAPLSHVTNTSNPHSTTASQVGAPTLTGTGASGTWGISITGTAATATNAAQTTDPASTTYRLLLGNGTNAAGALYNFSSLYYDRATATIQGANISGNAATVGGLSLASGSSSPGANQIIRSMGSGYTYLGYINSDAPSNENPPIGQVIVTNNSDTFYRKSSIASFTSAVQANAGGSWGINITGNAATATTATNATYGQYLWSTSHPGTYYISAAWDSTYWYITSNHSAGVRVSRADTAGNAATTSQTSWATLSTTAQLTATGNQATGMATGAGSLGGVMVQGPGAGGGAFMSFHRPGIYAAYFGLDTDNQWKVGGWSAGAVAYPILHSGNYSAYALPLTGGTLSGNLVVGGGDITAYRAGGTTGVIFLNSAGSRYLYYDGSGYQMPGAGLTVNGYPVVTTVNDTSWTSASLTGYLLNYGSPWTVPGYRKDSLAVVHLRGLAYVNVSIPAQSTLFTLPVGFRPATRRMFTVCASTTTNNIRLDVYTTGEVVCLTYVASGGYISFDGVEFIAEQ